MIIVIALLMIENHIENCILQLLEQYKEESSIVISLGLILLDLVKYGMFL